MPRTIHQHQHPEQDGYLFLSLKKEYPTAAGFLRFVTMSGG